MQQKTERASTHSSIQSKKSTKRLKYEVKNEYIYTFHFNLPQPIQPHHLQNCPLLFRHDCFVYYFLFSFFFFFFFFLILIRSNEALTK